MMCINLEALKKEAKDYDVILHQYACPLALQ